MTNDILDGWCELVRGERIGEDSAASSGEADDGEGWMECSRPGREM